MRDKTGTLGLAILLIMLGASPINSQTLLDQGILSFNMSDYEGAIDYIEDFLETNPYSEQAYEYLVNSYLALNRTSEALTTLEKAVNHFPRKAQFYRLMGQLYTQHEEYEKASVALEKYLQLSPDDSEIERMLSTITYNLGIMAAQGDKLHDALEYLDRAIELDSSYMEAYQNKAAVLIELEDLDRAEKHLEKARKRFPYNDMFDKAYFDVLVKQEKYREALPVMEAIVEREPENIDLALQLGILYRYLNEIDKAMSLYDDLIKEYPRERKIYNAVIEYWSNFNRQDKIRQTYELMLETFPDDLDIHLNIAETYEREEEWDKAQTKYDELIEKHPENAQIYLLKADTYVEQDSLSRAISTLKLIFDFDIQNYEAFKQLGDIYQRQDEYKKALQHYSDMYKYHPDDFHAVYHLGLAYKNNDRPDSAEIYFLMANNISPSEPSPYFALGQIEDDRGKTKEAASMFKEALNRGIKQMSHLQGQAEAGLSSSDGAIDFNQLSKYETLQNNIKRTEFIIENSLEYLKANYSHDQFGDVIKGYLRLYPSSLFLHLYQAEWYLEAENVRQAKSSYKKVISLNPETAEAHLGLAKIYENDKEYDKASRSFIRVLTIDDEYSKAYDGMIRIYDEQGKLDDLAELWLENYRNNPKNDVLRERLIEVLHKAKRFDDAREIIELGDDEKS